MPKIRFNGQEYDSAEEMPPEVRKLFEMATGMLADNDKDGTPDIFQSLTTNMTTLTGATQYVINGKTYAGLEVMPPEVRKQYQQLIQHVDANSDGVPDMLEGGVITSSIAMGGRVPPPSPTAKPAQPQLVKVVGEQGSQSSMLMIAALVIIILVGAVVFLLLTR